jgi:hypothetical protein
MMLLGSIVSIRPALGQTAKADPVGAGIWQRQAHPGGETWSYTFNVGSAPQDAPQTQVYGQGMPAAVGFARPPAAARAVTLQPNVVDINVGRVYLMTAASGGVEVPAPVAGQIVYAFADWTMTGDGTNQVTLEARVLFDGVAICGGQAQGVYFDGPWTEYCSRPVYATAGTHTIRWDFNYNQLLPEQNYVNDTLQMTFTPVAAPIDLSAQRASMRSASGFGGIEVASPNVGNTVYFHLQWLAYGAVSPLGVDIRATLDGATYCSFTATGITGGPWVSWCPAGWAATPGTHTLQWDIDYNNAIAETSETNNAASRIVTPGSSDGSSPDSGWWWDPNLGGTGFFIEHGGKSTNGLFVGAFLYDGGATATWLVSTGPMIGNTFTGTWLRVRGGQTLTGGYKAVETSSTAGDLKIAFSDSSHGILTRPDGTQIRIQRFAFGADPSPTPPQAGSSQVGWWWQGPANAGTGIGIEFQGSSIFMVTYVYTPGGDPIWYLATGSMASANTYTGTWDLYGGGPMLTSPEGSYEAQKKGSASSLTLTFSDATHATLTMNGVITRLTRFDDF